MDYTKEENFIFARKSLREGELDNALGHYSFLNQKDPNNAEAEFFAAYLGFKSLADEGDGASAGNAFRAMTNCIEKAVKCVKESEGDAIEKRLVLFAMVKVYTPIIRFLFTKRLATSNSTIESGVLGLYALGSAIKDEFGTDEEIMKLVVEPWKEAVSLQRQFYNLKCDGINPENYVAEIQKFDPSYTMPKKAGCVSIAK